MQQLHSIADTKWNTLLATKMEALDVTVTQEFVAGASILVRKWQDYSSIMTNFKHAGSHIVPELGPPFSKGQGNEPVG
jgi:hypothetical protein